MLLKFFPKSIFYISSAQIHRLSSPRSAGLNSMEPFGLFQVVALLSWPAFTHMALMAERHVTSW